MKPLIGLHEVLEMVKETIKRHPNGKNKTEGFYERNGEYCLIGQMLHDYGYKVPDSGMDVTHKELDEYFKDFTLQAKDELERIQSIADCFLDTKWSNLNLGD